MVAPSGGKSVASGKLSGEGNSVSEGGITATVLGSDAGTSDEGEAEASGGGASSRGSSSSIHSGWVGGGGGVLATTAPAIIPVGGGAAAAG